MKMQPLAWAAAVGGSAVATGGTNAVGSAVGASLVHGYYRGKLSFTDTAVMAAEQAHAANPTPELAQALAGLEDKRHAAHRAADLAALGALACPAVGIAGVVACETFGIL